MIYFRVSCLQGPDKLSPSSTDAQGSVSEHWKAEQQWHLRSRHFGSQSQPSVLISISVAHSILRCRTPTVPSSTWPTFV